MLSELSLFSGYGGFSLGLRLAGLAVKTVGYCEIEPYCQEIIKARIKDGLLDWAPIIRDIRSTDFRPMAGLVDIITAGFPCQPHSTAGKRQGETDERNLWPDTLRAISEVGPRWVLLENVPGILSNGYAGTVVGQLAELGYQSRWGVVSAVDAGANHLRKRWWLLAYSYSYGNGLNSQEHGEQPTQRGLNAFNLTKGLHREVANANEPGLQDRNETQKDVQLSASRRGSSERREWWEVEPELGRVAHGIAHRVDRLKALGNGVVPAVVKRFLEGS